MCIVFNKSLTKLNFVILTYMDLDKIRKISLVKRLILSEISVAKFICSVPIRCQCFVNTVLIKKRQRRSATWIATWKASRRGFQLYRREWIVWKTNMEI